MIRGSCAALAISASIVALLLVVLDFAELLVWPAQRPCRDGLDHPVVRWTRRRRGPHVQVHRPGARATSSPSTQRGTPDGTIIPDETRRLDLVLRVAAGPGDVIVGRDGAVFVNGVKFDDIERRRSPA